MNKRFMKESKNHQENNLIDVPGKINSKVENCYYIFHDMENINFNLIIDNQIVDIKIMIPIDYPFKPPKVFIKNTHLYKSLLRVDPIFRNRFKKYITMPECLCCNTILCDWAVVYGISNILEEIKTNFCIIKKIKSLIFAKYIVDKYIGFEFNEIYKFL